MNIVNDDLLVVAATEQSLVSVIKSETEDVAVMLGHHGSRLRPALSQSFVQIPQQHASIITTRSQDVTAMMRKLHRIHAPVMTCWGQKVTRGEHEMET